MHRYDLIAVDLDGTLISPDGSVHPWNVEMVHAAHAAGICVTLCTGRALIETTPTVERIGSVDPVIVSGGAMVACPVTGGTLERFAIDEDLVGEAVEHLHSSDHPALLLKDPAVTGYDYLIVTPKGPEAIDPASSWWFRKMKVRTRYVSHVKHDPHPADTVRVGAYLANKPIDSLATTLRTRFDGRTQIQHFKGVMLPDDRRDNESGIESVHIVELFHHHADKWMALQRLAKRMGIPLERVAAIGDQHNDLTMVGGAGLGIAMGNATPEVAAVSKRTTLRSEEAGVAHALERILTGEW
ncbi:MAG TPA: HAD family hydrolase [Phycisphaerales bacterium]|nr:HAD family hydrolase [Phycisphaerales bacterium]